MDGVFLSATLGPVPDPLPVERDLFSLPHSFETPIDELVQRLASIDHSLQTRFPFLDHPSQIVVIEVQPEERVEGFRLGGFEVARARTGQLYVRTQNSNGTTRTGRLRPNDIVVVPPFLLRQYRVEQGIPSSDIRVEWILSRHQYQSRSAQSLRGAAEFDTLCAEYRRQQQGS